MGSHGDKTVIRDAVRPGKGRQRVREGRSKASPESSPGQHSGNHEAVIQSLARRYGAKRISGLIYEKTRGVLKIFPENVIGDAVTSIEHARRKTFTAMDVVYALKRQDRNLYGFGGENV
ncbi:hypothetical protein R6Q59_026680 [Mikania micrantha]